MTRRRRAFSRGKFDFWSFFLSGMILRAGDVFMWAFLAVILLNIIMNGWSGLSWPLYGTEEGIF